MKPVYLENWEFEKVKELIETDLSLTISGKAYYEENEIFEQVTKLSLEEEFLKNILKKFER